MLASAHKACPFCLLALIGITLLICIPDLATQMTPIGRLAIWLLWLPLISALLRAGLVRLARQG